MVPWSRVFDYDCFNDHFSSKAKSSSVALNGLKNHQFKNWAETYSCSPSLYFEPNTYDELKEIIELAKSNEKKIRCVGCGHSPSDIACTKDYMVSLNKLNRILDVRAARLTFLQTETLSFDAHFFVSDRSHEAPDKSRRRDDAR